MFFGILSSGVSILQGKHSYFYGDLMAVTIPPSSAKPVNSGSASPNTQSAPSVSPSSSTQSATSSVNSPAVLPAPLKPFTTVQQQIQKLKSRNCVITDPAFAEMVLKQVTYYHLSAYFLPFRQKGGTYSPGTTFEKVYSIFEFDQKMRNILFKIIEKIELYLRSEFANFHGGKYGPAGYLDVSYFGNSRNHAIFLQRVNESIRNRITDPVVQHHNSTYGGVIPIWSLFGLVTFGTLTMFYSSLNAQDQKQLAQNMYNGTPTQLRSWLKCCNDLRNDCAHASRLYFRSRLSVPWCNQNPGFEQHSV